LRVASADAHGGDTGVTSVHAVEKASKAVPHDLHWSYDGQGGPESWGKLKPEFAKCATGARQSPIDIRDGIQVNLDPVQFDYKPSSFRVIDNGHTVQVNVAPGNFIEVGGKRFELLQFHFHRPSEERVDGKQFDMVAHLVHKDADGKLAVVAVLLERGSAQGVIQAVWNNLPLEKGEELAARGTINLNDLLPGERSYFTYMGSLTTPPCSEGVLWMVMKQPVQISSEQIGIFARLYYRDGKDRYLADLPLVMRHTRRVVERYAALNELHRLLDRLETLTPGFAGLRPPRSPSTGEGERSE